MFDIILSTHKRQYKEKASFTLCNSNRGIANYTIKLDGLYIKLYYYNIQNSSTSQHLHCSAKPKGSN